MICPTNCLPASLPTLSQSLISEFGKPETNKWGIGTILIQTCDVTVTDATDVSQWEAHVASGKLSCLPNGTVNYPTPGQTNIVYNGCDDEMIGLLEHSFEYITHDTRTDGKDYQYYCSLFGQCGVITAIPVDCDGFAFVNRQFADAVNSGGDTSSISPGLSFSFTSIPHKGKDGEIGQWTMTLKHKNSKQLCPIEFTDVVQAVCQPC